MNLHRRRFLRGIAGLLGILGPVAAIQAKPKRPRTTADGSRSKPVPPEDAPKPPVAASPDETPAMKAAPHRLRLWKVSDVPDQLPQIRLLPHDKPDSAALAPLQAENGSYQFSSYVDVEAGPMVVEITAPNRPAVRLPVYPMEGGATTLLVRQQGGSLSGEWIDDTPEHADNAACEFRIYNLLPASGEIQVNVGEALAVHLAAARASLRLYGIKRGLYQVATTGVDGKGKNFSWNTEADFRHNRKASLLIYPDPYGRIRPRVNAE